MYELVEAERHPKQLLVGAPSPTQQLVGLHPVNDAVEPHVSSEELEVHEAVVLYFEHGAQHPHNEERAQSVRPAMFQEGAAQTRKSSEPFFGASA